MLLRTWRIAIFWCFCMLLGWVSGLFGVTHTEENVSSSPVYAGRMDWDKPISVVTDKWVDGYMYQRFINGKHVNWLVTHPVSYGELHIADSKVLARKDIHARYAFAVNAEGLFYKWIAGSSRIGIERHTIFPLVRISKRVARYATEHLISYREIAYPIYGSLSDNRRSRMSFRKSLFSVYVSIS